MVCCISGICFPTQATGASYTREYAPYGNTIAQSGTQVDANPYRFGFKHWDGKEGPYYYGYRHYNPELGRWLSRDPLSERSIALDFLFTSSGHSLPLPDARAVLLSDHFFNTIVSSVFAPAEKETYIFVQNSPASAYDCKCPKGSHKGTRQKKGYVKTPNGCSNPFFSPPFKDNPSGIPGCSFKGSCDKHDCCYGRCNSSKAGCDAAFYGRMLWKCMLCTGWNPVLLMQCNNWAGIYYAAVVGGGKSAYDDNQNNACEECCCP